MCVVSRRVVENDFEISQFLHSRAAIGDQPSAWFFVYGDEDNEFLALESNLFIMPLSEVIFSSPFVRHYIHNPVGSNFCYDSVNDRVRDWTAKRTLTFDRKTFAPNAVNIKLEPLVWLKYFPGSATSAVLALSFIILAIVYHPAWLLLTVYFATLAMARWARVYEVFKFGESLPGLVISTHPNLMAVGSMLGEKSHRRYVKIVKLKFKRIAGRSVVVGDRIATAATFPKRTWHSSRLDFVPFPINYATEDLNKIEACLNRCHPREWDILGTAVSHLNKPYKCGLYEIPDFEPRLSDLVEETETFC